MTTTNVPRAFWIDHVERALRCGETCPDRDRHQEETTWPETSRGYDVELSDADRFELLSDARHYSDYTTWGSHEGIGIQSSARATVKRLEKD